jgi:predicted nuclease of predicted toxin-antitoxin system
MQAAFLLDEDTEAALADKLASAGHDVERVATVDDLGTGSKDHQVLAYASQTNSIIVTHDDDYAEADQTDHAGVFYGPNQRLSSHQLYRIIQHVLDAYPSRDAMQPVIYLTTDWL